PPRRQAASRRSSAQAVPHRFALLPSAAWLAARQRPLSDAENVGEKISLDQVVGRAARASVPSPSACAICRSKIFHSARSNGLLARFLALSLFGCLQGRADEALFATSAGDAAVSL